MDWIGLVKTVGFVVNVGLWLLLFLGAQVLFESDDHKLQYWFYFFGALLGFLFPVVQLWFGG